MKTRNAFTLVELMVALMLFGFMSAAMASIYATANRHLFQDYRGNMVKGNVTVAMRAIGNVMAQATSIDAPGTNAKGNILTVASNVDQLTGCYPLKSGLPVTLYKFCASGSDFYYGFKTFWPAAGCVSPLSGCCGALAYPSGCGSGGGATWIKLLPGSLDTTSNIFSRKAAEKVNDLMSVRVGLTGKWTPPGNLATLQRTVTFTLDSTFSVSRSN
ncbi:MAG: hypothetical protein COT18_06595 [Elusimicrobia bacterium CG08_land_8_20_14_0_20_59_10]|nr:MAG: hypothetical protein COT18_06595 [Elusimicrobia bacterium CG08_land_8_20_14_0_20_59_10]